MANVVIDIAAQFTGKTAFDKAQNSTEQLQKSVKNLGRTLGLALGGAAVVKGAKDAVKAFAADEKAARSLSLALANTGNAFAQMDVESFIQRMQRTTGVLDDELRPAFRSLITATGDVKKSQDALALALDISAGTGKDLSAVTMALAKAYGGQTTALSRLGAGLDKATLATGDMDLITQELQKRFSGQALEATKGFAGQMALLTVAVNDAKEAIGKGLVDALNTLGGGQGGTGGAIQIINNLATGIAEGAKNIAYMIKQFESLKPIILTIGAALLVAFAPITAAVAALGFILAKGGQNLKKAEFRKGAIPGGMGNVAMTGGSNQDTQRAQADAAQKSTDRLLKTEKARLNNLKKITAEQQKKVVLDKLSAFLTQAQKLFDLDRIQLAAAAMSKQTEEDKVRIRLKQEILDLEDAINSGNVEGAVKLASAISKDAELLSMLRGDMIKLGDVPNPFAEWLATLNAMLATLLALANVAKTLSFNVFSAPAGSYVTGGGTAGGNLGSDVYQSTLTGQALVNKLNKIDSENSFPRLANGGIVNKATMAMIGESGPEAVIPLNRMGSMGGTTVNVVVQGSVTTQQDLVNAITQGIYNNQASGTPITYSTVY